MSLQSKPVNIGMVGAGFIGQLAHLANYVEIDGCKIVALAELRPDLRRRVCQRYDIPRSYSTHKELINDPEVDAVVVVTPRSMTGPIALDCLSAGKHLMSEKPMAGTVEQAEKLVETAKNQGVLYAVGYLKRHDSGIQKAKQILDELLATKELGPVTFVRSHNFMGESYFNIDGHIVTTEKVPDNRTEWPISPNWMSEKIGFQFARYLNTHCHNINLLRYLFDQTPSVNYVRLGQLEAQVAIFDFDNFPCIMETGNFKHRGWDDNIEIYFSSGRLRIVGPQGFLRNAPARVELYKGGDINEIIIPQNEWSWGFRRQAESFINNIREGNEPLANAEDALNDMRLVEKMWQMETNQT